jgi:hypothetical protein
MGKTREEIQAKVREIYDLVSASDRPISLLRELTRSLAAEEKWKPDDVERVSGEVMGLIIRYGGRKPTSG